MADLSIPLAEANVDDAIELDAIAPTEAHVRAGQTVRFRYAYRFEETTKEEEQWVFRLVVRVDDGEELVDQRTHDDRRAKLDDTVANLHHDIKFKAGTHQVAFSAEAQRTVRDWNTAKASNKLQRKVGGTITVHAS